jgi:AcrR family transcriptional regulator
MGAPVGMEPLTIGALEREAGVARGTIYYYLRYGLLPPAQKASATRSVYDQAHVELLKEIKRLQAEGNSLAQVRDLLSPRIEAAAENGVDLVAKQNEATRKVILEVAARRFARQGYDKTRIVDICDEVGVTIQVLYSHFPSKHHLFIACYNVYFQWMRDQIGPQMAELADPTARLAWRAYAFYGIQALSPALQVLARLQTIDPRSGLSDLLRETYAQMLSDVGEDLAAVGEAAAAAAAGAARGAGGALGGESGGDADACAGDESGGSPSADAGLFDDELVAYALLGALENMQVRASWDEKYDRLDVMRNLLAIHLAIRAAYAGKVDLTPDWETVAELAAKLSASTPKAEGPGS